MTKNEPKRIVIGISGASGIPLAVRCLRILATLPEWETHLVVTESAKVTLGYESNLSLSQLAALADVYHEGNAIGASIASGTFKTEGMIVVPCSMKTVAGIASGYSDNLLLRAADVTLKEQRTLVLVARETPMSAIHLDNLARLAHLPGVFIMPPVLTYYIEPESIEDMEHHLAGKILGRFGIEIPDFHRWSDEGIG